MLDSRNCLKTTLRILKTTLRILKTTLRILKTTLRILKTTLRILKTTLRILKTTLRILKTTLRILKTTLRILKTTLRILKTTSRAFNQDALEQADLNNTDSTRTDTSDESATATPTTASTSSATGTLDDIAKPKDLDERANDYKMINKIYDNIVLCIDTNTTWKYIEPPASLSQVTRDEVEPATTASPGQAGILVFQAPANLESRAKYSAKPLATKTYIKSRTIRIGDNDTNFTSRPFHLHARNEKVSGINIFNSIAFN
ncbi:hypothetical protein ABC855_g4809 [[Candida] zeylanoides]